MMQNGYVAFFQKCARLERNIAEWLDATREEGEGEGEGDGA